MYLFLQLCMLGSVVPEGMHENKFQGDTLMEFIMAVFGDMVMTFFPHKLYVSRGFLIFFSSGFLSRASNQV